MTLSEFTFAKNKSQNKKDEKNNHIPRPFNYFL